MNAKTITTIESLHPQYIIDQKGEKTSVILSIEVFQALLKILKESRKEDHDDLSLSKPNAETLKAFKDIEEGNTTSHESVDALIADLHA